MSIKKKLNNTISIDKRLVEAVANAVIIQASIETVIDKQ
jgi:hypothetical protein